MPIWPRLARTWPKHRRKTAVADAQPGALVGIKKAIHCFMQTGSNTDKEKLDKAFRVLKAQLKDNKIRHRLLNLIPGIVQGLVVDTANRRYQIKALDGQLSDWRKV